MKLTFYAVKEGWGLGGLLLEQPEAHLKAIENIKLGERVKITFEIAEKSSAQLGYYNGVVLLEIRDYYSKESGIVYKNKDELHQELVEKYCQAMDVELDVSETDKEGFGLYLDWLIGWANDELGLQITKARKQR
jgi:hypothetical protein